MTNVALKPTTPAQAGNPGTTSLGSALFLTLLLVIGLGALSLWPRNFETAPRRPELKAPIVFDEFVNPPSAAAPSAEH